MLNGFSQLKHIIFTLFSILSVFAYAQESNRRLSFSSELNFYQGVGRYNVDDISFNNNGIAGSFLGNIHFKVADNFLIGVKGGYAGTNDPVRSMLVAGLDFLRYEQGKQSGWFSQLAIGAYLGERPRYSNGGFLEIKRGYAFPVWIFRASSDEQKSRFLRS